MDRYLWILNLDVEDELGRAGQPYTRPRAVEARIRALAGRLTELTGGGEVVVGAGGAGARAGGAGARAAIAYGRAWCPVPSALQLIARAGARVPSAPAEAILRCVLHRRFAIERGLGWAQTRWIDRVEALQGVGDAATARDRSIPPRWRLKRAYGYAGRGQRVVRADALDAADRAWIAASIAHGGGVAAEPELDADGLATPALHGYLHPDGAVVLGEPTLQRVDARGAWQDTTRTALDAAARAALQDAATRSAHELHAAGYFGAFGIDALVGRLRGEPVMIPLGELNARYTMGWATGMGQWRPSPGLP